jgi:CHAD domain-containing protein
MRHATTLIAEGLAAAVTHQYAILARRLPRALEGNRGAVHRVRVASRRLREALVVAAAAQAPGSAARLRREVRRLTRDFGPVREIDVVAEEFERVAPRHLWSRDRVAAVRRRLERERERRRAACAVRVGEIDDEALERRVEAVAAAIRARAADPQWWRGLAAHVISRADAVTGALAECGTLYAPERLHRLRIAIKKLRYAVECLCEDARPSVRRAARALADAQDRFGRLHDVQMLAAEVQAMAGAGRTALTAGFIEMADVLDRDCRQRHAALLTDLPSLKERVLALRADLAARLGEGRLPMAKATMPAAQDGRRPGGAPARTHRRHG